MAARFDPALTRALATIEEVDIETSRAPERPTRRVTIWIVVVGDEVYVRSVRGPVGRWYRDARANPRAALHLGDRSVAVHAVPVTDAATIGRVSEAFRSKYAASPYAPPMVRDEVLETTLRLDPG